MQNLGIEVRGLSKSFSKRKGLMRARKTVTHALREVSFEVARGETYVDRETALRATGGL